MHHQGRQHTIDINEIRHMYGLEFNTVAPEALAQHAELTRNLNAHACVAGKQLVNVHPFIVGSAGAISQSLHTILIQCGITCPNARQELLKEVATVLSEQQKSCGCAPPQAHSPSTGTPGVAPQGPGSPPTAIHRQILQQSHTRLRQDPSCLKTSQHCHLHDQKMHALLTC